MGHSEQRPYRPRGLTMSGPPKSLGHWDTGRLDRNERGSVVFDEPGSFPYFCVYHPNMTAVVTVQ